jgi:hypothetical protein
MLHSAMLREFLQRVRKLTRVRAAPFAAALVASICVVFAPAAHADYAVLNTGVRLHISGYEQAGLNVRLHVDGGTVDVPADTIVRYEPEEIFARAIVPVTEVELTVPYAQFISAAAKKYGLDPQLLARVVQAESNFNPRAISTKNAQGLMQIIPSTASRMTLRNPFDPAQSIEAGAHYLRQMLDKFSGNVELALAAYNAGPDRVVQYHGVPPYRETRNYIRKITKPAPKKPTRQKVAAAIPGNTSNQQ